MARPPAKELTERELEVMHVFWTSGQATAAEIRDQLAAAGRELAYTTVATLIRILSDKGFLEQTNTERPFQYRPVRSFEDVSRSMVGDLIERVFRGSREQLLVRLLEERELTAKERALLETLVTASAASREKKSDEHDRNRPDMVHRANHALSLLAGGLYLLVRRLRPAAAAPVVFSSLAIVVILSVLALSPWPRWTIDRATSLPRSNVRRRPPRVARGEQSASRRLGRLRRRAGRGDQLRRPFGRGAGVRERLPAGKRPSRHKGS